MTERGAAIFEYRWNPAHRYWEYRWTYDDSPWGKSGSLAAASRLYGRAWVLGNGYTLLSYRATWAESTDE
jgi:hypothetical protein